VKTILAQANTPAVPGSPPPESTPSSPPPFQEEGSSNGNTGQGGSLSESGSNAGSSNTESSEVDVQSFFLENPEFMYTLQRVFYVIGIVVVCFTLIRLIRVISSSEPGRGMQGIGSVLLGAFAAVLCFNLNLAFSLVQALVGLVTGTVGLISGN